MNDWKYFFDYELNTPQKFNYRIFASDSKAEILYWFSRDDIPKQQKEAFIWALVNFDDNCGGFYRYRAYFLAAEALNYFPECSFGNAIVKQLLDWSYLYFGWQLFPKPLVEAARKTLEVTDKTRVIKAFECLLRNTPSRLTLQSAATKLGELDAGNKMAIAALILLLDVTKDSCRQASICKSIAKIGIGNQAAISAVIKLMETTEDNKYLFCKAIKTLGKISCGNQTAILALEKFLQLNRGDEICLDAAKSLLFIDKGNEVAWDTLLFLLESTQELYLLIKAVEFLQEVDFQNKAAIKVLSERWLLIDDGISQGIKSLLNAIKKDKRLCRASNYITDEYYNFEEEHFWYIWRNVDSVNKKGYFPKIITALKEYLGDKFYKSASSRYDDVYQLLWDYSENITYQDFYKAWNS